MDYDKGTTAGQWEKTVLSVLTAGPSEYPWGK